MDTRTTAQRRKIMQAVGAKNTKPELAVRKILWRLGARYRLHHPNLPGRPDIALMGLKKAVFVHGCFWHGHSCPKGRLPRSRLDYWELKIRNNQERDQRKETALEKLGWSFLIVWQCELKNPQVLERKLIHFLRPKVIRKKA